MNLLIICGISGAGKTITSNTLEDIGYHCIDNLPPNLLLNLNEFDNDAENEAIIVDTATEAKCKTLIMTLNILKDQNVKYKLVFLTCDDDTVLNRYKYTRRTHPLISQSRPSILEAINYEIEMTKQIRSRADILIDSTHLSGPQLRNMINDTFKIDSFNGLTIKLVSFGYKNGLPSDADLVFDVRCVPNPFYVKELRNLSGNDQAVIDYIFSFEQSKTMLDNIYQFVFYGLPYYVKEGKNELIIAIGCTSGHHRSVTFVQKLEEKLRNLNYRIVVMNRDIDKEF